MDARRQLAREHQPRRNGLDYVEVGCFPCQLSEEYSERAKIDSQFYLTVFFLGKLSSGGKEWRLSAENFRITGGRCITGIRVLEAKVYRALAKDEDDMAVLRVDKAGDFSCYTLEIVDAPEGAPAEEYEGKKCRPCQQSVPVNVARDFDQRYSRLEFSFKVNCPSTLDCWQPQVCAEPVEPPPTINYLAKDYAGFRELILDRLALTLPDWKERHVPDAGIAVAEIMAYHADRISYYQDAVAQEAYLDTARRRISVRRHARLVDYILHEGCNARAWVCCDPAAPLTIQPGTFDMRTAAPDAHTKPLIYEPVRRVRDAMLEAGDFFDLRAFVAKLLNDNTGEVTRRLSRKLRRALRKDRAKDKESPLPDDLTARLISELNARVLLDRTFAAEEAPAGDLAAISEANRSAFDALNKDDCVALHGIYLDPAHAEMRFYTWQNHDCCLEQGAVQCWLVDAWADTAAIQAEIKANDTAATDGLDARTTDECGCDEKEEQPVHPPRARRLKLRAGDVLIFEVVTGPTTGNDADADKSRRCAVRLTRVEPVVDALTDTPLLRVEWAAADALPFSFCLSKMGPPPGCAWLTNLSVARGNVVLVDHGETLPCDDLGKVEREDLDYRCRCVGVLDEISVRPRPFRPSLDEPELTFAVPLAAPGPASGELDQKPWKAVPSLKVESLPPLPDGEGPVLSWAEMEKPDTAALVQRDGVWNLLCAATQEKWRGLKAGGTPSSGDVDAFTGCIMRAIRPWQSRLDLLGSGAQDRHFVVEMDDGRRAWLRFGKDGLGATPEAGETFHGHYRTGNGPAGNTGLETITEFHAKNGTLGDFTVRNPLPARGGTAHESLADARRDAPHVFRLRQLRAITADDYARLAEKNPRLQRAGAELRWTGSRQSVRVALDPLHMADAPADLIAEVCADLLKYRRIGHDLEVIPALYVPIELELDICVHSHALRGDVEAAVLDALTAGLRRDGTPGFFHPDRITFGEPVRISRIIAAVQPPPGVMSVKVTRLVRYGGQPCCELTDGVLPIGPLEVARLDQDPDFPENGTLKLNLGGGR
jgi:hypothetical protein